MKSGQPFKKWRKRKPSPHGDREKTSTQLREARDLIQRRKYAEGLQLLDVQGSAASSPLMKAKILGLAGDACAKQGKLPEALEAYQKSEQNTASHPRAWLRPAIAQVRHLLRHGKVEDSFEVARKSVARSLKEERDFKKLVQSIARELEEKGQFIVIQRPPRSSVVSTRLGHLFLNEGELEAARFFFEKVVEINPKGGCRARLGMAEIFLRSRDHQKAQEWALDGIRNGKFQAKTLSGWKLLIAARRGLEMTGLPSAEAEWLKKNSLSPVGIRALQIVVVELRKAGDPLWQSLTQDWLAGTGAKDFPATAYNFRRMLLSSAQTAGANPQALLSIAWSMWNTGSLSLLEHISAARAVVSGLLASQQEVLPTPFVETAKKQFGKEGGDRMAQAISELLFQFGREKPAMVLLEAILASTPVGSKRWGRSTWRLAKYKASQGNIGEAAELYLSIAEQSKTPERIRNFSLVEALRAATVSGRQEIARRAKPFLKSALGLMEDPALLLDMSRQLGSAPDCRELAQAFRKKGEQAVRTAIASATTPSAAVTWLFQYARRQNDWGDFDGTIAVWESMDEARKLWLWTPKMEFWEYLAYVLRSYGWKKRLEDAEKMAAKYVDDPATPADGTAILGNSYAAILIHHGHIPRALEIFRQVVGESPRHPYAAYAYYWFALQAVQNGDFKKVEAFAASMRDCLDDRSRLSWICELLIKSHILGEMARGTPPESIPARLASQFPAKEITRFIEAIKIDRRRIS